MKRLFLTSEFHFVAKSIASKLGDDKNKPMVFIDTCLHNREYTDSELQWHFANKAHFEQAGFHYKIYDISGKTESEIKHDLDQYSIMYVEGGNTPYLLQQSRLNNFSNYVKSRVNDGMIYISTSAGSVIVGPDITANGRPGKTAQDFGLKDSKGFGIVYFVVLPHWGDPKKEPDYQKYKIPSSYTEQYPYIILTNNQYVEVTDDWYKIVDVTKE